MPVGLNRQVVHTQRTERRWDNVRVAHRIGIDTNLLIAALTKPSGVSGHLLQAWRDGQIENVASEATVREAELVLGGGWLARMVGRERVEALLRDMRERFVWVEEPAPIDDLDLKDAGDLRMVEAAVAGGAELIVTTDREFLSKRGYGSVEFVTPSEAVKRLGLPAPDKGTPRGRLGGRIQTALRRRSRK